MRITALMFVTMVLAALAVDVAFDFAGLIPTARPAADEIMSPVELDYKLVLNAFATVVFAVLMWLTVARDTDPVVDPV